MHVWRMRCQPHAAGPGREGWGAVEQGLGAAPRPSGPGPPCMRGGRGVSPMQQALGAQGLGAACRPSGPGLPCIHGECSVSPTQQAPGRGAGGAGPWSSTQTQWAWAAVHAWRTQCQPHAAGPGLHRALEQHADPAGPGRRACVENTVSAPCTWHLWGQWCEGEALSLHWR